MFFLSSYRSEFLTCIIFLVTKELLLMFLTTHVYWQQIPSIFICLRNSLFLLQFFLNIFFDVDHLKKSFVNSLQLCLCSVFWFFGQKPHGFLAPWLGIEPAPPPLSHTHTHTHTWILNHWTTREVLISHSPFLKSSFIYLFILAVLGLRWC